MEVATGLFAAFTGPCDPCRGCKSYFNPNRGTFCKMDKFNDAIKTPNANLNHPLVRSRFVYASLFIFRVGSFYFDLFPFVHIKKNHVN
jgi:hypothetical protein